MTALKKVVDAQIGELPRWDLAPIYPGMTGPELAADKKLYEKKVADFAQRYEGKVETLESGVLANAVLAYEELAVLGSKLGSYAGLLQSVTIGDEKAGQVVQSVEDLLSEQGSKLVFFTLELNKIDDAKMKQMLKESQTLATYAYWIELARANKPHELSPELEKFDAEKTAARDALLKIYEETHDELRFKVGGKQLRQSEIMAILSSEKDESKRKEAYLAFSEGLALKQKLFTRIYDTLIKDKQVEDRWRKFPTPQSSRHLANQVEAAVVDSLTTTVCGNYANLSHRYYALKAKWLGKDKLDPWDRNAPLPMTDTSIVPFEEGKKIVLDAYRAFSPKLADLAAEHFTQNRIDAPSVEGKDSGAFAHPTTKGIPGYVLLNYQGRSNDVVTMAHELGHGVHHDLAKAQQPELLTGTPLTLAETASVFGEMMTFKALLAKETDPAKRQAMIAGKVEGMLNTVVRQISFYTFESKAHEERKKQPLTSDKLAELWQETMKEAHGPAMRDSKEYDVFWSYIPHIIHTPFYVYAYAFGDCLVNSLYGAYEQEKAAGRGDQFVDKYIDLLKSGGSKGHKDLLAPFGLDATKPDFWQKGIDVIAGFIDELEALDKQIGSGRGGPKGPANGNTPPTP